MIDVQRVFPRADELGIAVGGNDPLPLEPGREFLFFSVCRT